MRAGANKRACETPRQRLAKFARPAKISPDAQGFPHVFARCQRDEYISATHWTTHQPVGHNKRERNTPRRLSVVEGGGWREIGRRSIHRRPRSCSTCLTLTSTWRCARQVCDHIARLRPTTPSRNTHTHTVLTDRSACPKVLAAYIGERQIGRRHTPGHASTTQHTESVQDANGGLGNINIVSHASWASHCFWLKRIACARESEIQTGGITS